MILVDNRIAGASVGWLEKEIVRELLKLCHFWR
jgi:hypothetical protein